MVEFGALTQVEIRSGWPTEPFDFTPWLFEPKNMALLSEELGIQIEPVAREFRVGDFSLDILARRAGTDESVVIENQFGQTDHKHLGQLLTYASGVGTDGTGARSIIWIAERFNDQHRAAIDWLNKITEPGIRFFGVQLELWRIGDSPFAPRFNLVCKPNEWQKQVTQYAGVLTATENLYVDFWNAFFKFCSAEESNLNFAQSPRKVWWLPTTSAVSGCGINLTATKRSKEMQCQVWMDGSRGQRYFDEFMKRKADLKAKLGDDLVFDEMPGRSSRVIYQITECDIVDREQWPSMHSWLKIHGEAFHAAFDPLTAEISIQLQ